MIQKLFTDPVARLRLVGFIEGVTLLILVFVGVPLKYGLQEGSLVKVLGPIHGAAFLLFVFMALSVGVQYQWKFRHTTWKVLLATIIPFGTFYVDKKILSRM